MSERLLVSIVTPSYNQGQFIEETILSVKNQDYPNIEHIVMDGGSTDNTVEILKRYEGTYNMRWVSEPDEGQADALRKGFAVSAGDMLAWINSDDVYTADAVGAAVAALCNSKADVVYGNMYLIDSSRRRVGERRLSPFAPYFSRVGFLYGGFGVYQPAAFWTRDLYTKVRGIDTSFQFCMDSDLFIRFIRAGARFKFLGQFLVNFRVHDDSKTSTMSEICTKEWERILLGLPPKSRLYKLFIRMICRGWKVIFHLIDNRGSYVVMRLTDRKYRRIP
jgi:glycosyltransferase involved in cell wall biosynthesis